MITIHQEFSPNRKIPMIAAAIVLIGCLISAKIAFTWLMTHHSSRIVLAHHLITIAEDIAENIDKAAYIRIVNDAAAEQDYHHLLRDLRQYQAMIGAESVYTLAISGEGAFRTVDSSADDKPANDADASAFPAAKTHHLQQGKPIYTGGMPGTGDELRVAVPLFNEQGELLGAVGIDISANAFEPFGNRFASSNEYMLWGDFVFILLLFAVLFLLRTWSKWRAERERDESEEFYITEFGKMVDSLKMARHDLNNHLQVLRGMLEMKKYDKASQYLKALSEETRQLELSLDIDHPALLVLFRNKWALALNKKIHMEFSLDVDDFQWIESIDLVKIFSNLIDNAIEATELLPVEQRYVHVICQSEGAAYRFAVVNSAQLSPAEQRLLFQAGYSSKRYDNGAKGRMRGSGMTIIKQTAEKYGGQIAARYEDGKVTIEIVFSVKHAGARS